MFDTMNVLFHSCCWLALGPLLCQTSAATLEVQIVPRFAGAPLSFDRLACTNAAGQILSVTRLDFLLSEFGLHRPGGDWFAPTGATAYVSLAGARCSFQLRQVPVGRYDRIRFQVGV